MRLLTVKNLNIHFKLRNNTFHAVKDVSFHVDRSEVLGIVGESGSGKSITCKSLMRLIPSPPAKVEADVIEFDGQSLLGLSEREMLAYRGVKISFIFQDPMTCLNPYMSVGDQLIETVLCHREISRADAKQAAIAALEEVGLNDADKKLKAFPHQFSGGMRQRVMIAMALITEPELLIADEPTTALDVTIQAQILKVINDLQAKRKLSIIFITHDLGVISKIADRIIVMKHGEIVEEGEAQKVLKSPKHPYTSQLIDSIPTSSKPTEYALASSKCLLDAKNITVEYLINKQSWNFFAKSQVYTAVRDVSLQLNKGEIVGLVGESGSGKSTLGRALIRLMSPAQGTIIFDGEDISNPGKDLPMHLRRDIQMVFQDPYASLNPRKTIYHVLAEPLLRHGVARGDALPRKIEKLLNEVGLDADAAKKYPHQFSGGQRQRIAIARAISLEPKLIIADEAVSALDVTTQAQILELLLQLTLKYNLTLLFISHDLSVVRYICDRVIVMRSGQLIEEGSTEEIFNHPKESYTQNLIKAIPTL